MNVKDLREQMARIATEARSKLNEVTTATEEGRAAEIEREFDDMMSEHDRIGKLVERHSKLDDIEARARDIDVSKRPLPQNAEGRGVDAGKQIAYREAFYEMIRNGGIEGLEPEVRQVLRGGAQKVEARIQTAGTTTAGGFTVPTELANFIDLAMTAFGPMYNEDICTTLNTTSGASFKIPTVDDTNVTAEAHTEGTAPSV